MSKSDEVYKMRAETYMKGLSDLIDYINRYVDTSEINMIEIGSYEGQSTELFAQRFKKVIAIDPFIDDYDPNDITCEYMSLTKVYDIFLNNISKYDNVMHIRETSDSAFYMLPKIEIGFVYIDGLHTYDQIKKDISNYYTLIKSGFIAGHDYHPKWQGIVDGVNEMLGEPDSTFIDTSWIKGVNILEQPIKIKNNVFFDHRGVFAPLSLNTLDKNWIQSNISFNPERATFRGLHFQLGEFAQAKLVKVITGRIIDFVIDIRPDSDNYLNLYEFEILPGEELYVPRGFAHGFLTLDENTVVQYLVDNTYNPEAEGSIFWREVPGIVKIIEELMPNQPLNISEKDYFTKNFTFPEKNKDFL